MARPCGYIDRAARPLGDSVQGSVRKPCKMQLARLVGIALKVFFEKLSSKVVWQGHVRRSKKKDSKARD